MQNIGFMLLSMTKSNAEGLTTNMSQNHNYKLLHDHLSSLEHSWQRITITASPPSFALPIDGGGSGKVCRVSQPFPL